MAFLSIVVQDSAETYRMLSQYLHVILCSRFVFVLDGAANISGSSSAELLPDCFAYFPPGEEHR